MQTEKNGMATAGLICSICGFVTCGATSLIGLILSIIGLSNSKKANGKGKGASIAGIILSGIIIFTFFILLVSGTLASITNGSSSNSNDGLVRHQEQERTYEIGDTVTYKDFEITIENVDTANQVGGEYFKKNPSAGGIFVCVDIIYKNISDEPISSFSYPTIYLVDSKGTKYSSDLSASTYYATEKDQDRKVLSDLNPGISVNENNVYEISSDQYSSDSWYLLIGSKIKVKIK